MSAVRRAADFLAASAAANLRTSVAVPDEVLRAIEGGAFDDVLEWGNPLAELRPAVEALLGAGILDGVSFRWGDRLSVAVNSRVIILLRERGLR